MDTLGSFLIALPVLLTVYAYVAYPILLRVIAGRQRPARADAGELPLVSIVIPAYNEEAQIRGAIEALLSLDYPHELLQVLILSDASTDRTDDIVREYGSRGVELLRMARRGGKTEAENTACAHLRGSIVVNSDASIRLHPLAVRRLVDAMFNPRVGVASTRDVSISRQSSSANSAEAGYVGYEMRVRSLETLTGGIVGASGSGYAIRTELHRLPVRGDLSRDFAAALTARSNGYTAVSVDDALSFVPRTASLRAEYRRKVRTISRGLVTLLHNRHLLNPLRFDLFSWKLASHKICRWLVPPTSILGAVGLAILAVSHRWAATALLIGLSGLLLAAVGAIWPASRRMPRMLSTLTFATAANIAVVHAILRVSFGHEDHLWEPTRRPTTVSGD